jgi:hypothetical protein
MGCISGIARDDTIAPARRLGGKYCAGAARTHSGILTGEDGAGSIDKLKREVGDAAKKKEMQTAVVKSLAPRWDFENT